MIMNCGSVVVWAVLVSCSTTVWAQDASPRVLPTELTATHSPFVVKPYLQLGHTPAPGKIVLVWHSADADAIWTVDYRPGIGRRWERAQAPLFRRVTVRGALPHRVYHTALTDLQPGEMFAYRIRVADKRVIESQGRAPKAADQPYRFVTFGDCGADTPAQRQIALYTFNLKPDFVMITGDIVYSKGLVSEYRTKYWPIYNADTASAAVGAPLMRSTLFVAAPGNHDIASRDLEKTPDGLAYFYYWHQPDQRQLQFPTATITNAHRPQLIFLVAIPRSGVNLQGDCRGPTRARRQLQFPTDAC
jgi:acid phosphatase type 7